MIDGKGAQAHPARTAERYRPPPYNTICGWCGRPWDEIEDHDEPCAEDGGQFIGPHQKKIVPATEG